LKGDQVVRMVPYKHGKANHGHSCVKGRFAWGYATHKERITRPMIRDSISDPWREVGWDEAISFAAGRIKEAQTRHGRKSVGAISSSRCTIEEVWLVQKLVRTAFGNNNIDTCARVCHSPTGYGLKETYGTSAGTQDFDSVAEADVILVIGANPTDAHPVFASQMKRRLRQGAKLIVVDPRAIDLVRMPHVEARHHLQLQPGTNVALINAFSHVAAVEGLIDERFVEERCELPSFNQWLDFVRDEENSPEAVAAITGVPADEIRAAARLYATGGKAAIYYGLGVTEHSQGSTMVMGMANLAMATGNIGTRGVGVNPLRGQNNVQGSCDMGSFPHEFSDYRPVSDAETRALFEDAWGRPQDADPGHRIPNMFDEACAGNFKGLYVQGEDIAQSDPNTQHVEAALRALDILIVQDLFLNETARFAHVFLPGTSFLEKDGCFINAERRINRVRPVMESATGVDEWLVTQKLAQALGYDDMNYATASEIMDEIAMLSPSFSNVSHARLDEEGAGGIQWPCNEAAPNGTPIMHVDGFVRGKGQFVLTEFVPTTERTNRKFPLILTTGRILSQYNVGAQTRRTSNSDWHDEDVLEIHPADAEANGIREGHLVSVRSRKGETTLKAHISDRMAPGVVYTTFHHPETGANVVTTENSDWATNCPEYKVTAVAVAPANHRSGWQERYSTNLSETRRIESEAPAE
jgi:formate dehydrogenase major subunit